MSFSFTIPYITFLGLTLLIIIGITIFLVRRMNNQNQKFSSIVGVVTSLAEELNSIKMCISNSINNISNISTDTKIINTDLIPVSDDEDETDDDTDDADDTDDEDEDDTNDETYHEIDDETEEDDEEEDVTENIQVVEISKQKDVIDENVKYIHLDNSQQETHDIFEMVQEEIISTDSLPTEEDTIQPSIEEIQQETLIKDIDINIVKKEVNDYKKMSITKLKEIVSEKGLHDNISKLKKNDLIKILESHSE